MGVTPYKHELPLFVADSFKELSKMSGFDYDSIRHLISKRSSGKNKGIKFIKIIIDEEKEWIRQMKKVLQRLNNRTKQIINIFYLPLLYHNGGNYEI